MLNNSLQRLLDGIAAVLREQAIPALADDSVRSNVAGALVLLDLVKRRATWKAEFAEREQSCRALEFAKLPALLAGSPLASVLGSPPEPQSATTRLMDDYANRIFGLPDASGDAHGPRLELSRWALDYCMATVAAGAEKSSSATVGDVTRSSR